MKKEIDLFAHTQYTEPEPNDTDKVHEDYKGVPMFNTAPKESSLRVLALDVATKTGWATKNAHGLWDLTIKRDESNGMKYLRFRSKLKEVCQLENINLITFERSSGMHQSSVIHQSELHGVLKLFCEESNIQYKAYSASEVKKFATGKGNAGKPLMVSAAASKYGYNGGDDNVADALHIYHLTIKDINV